MRMCLSVCGSIGHSIGNSRRLHRKDSKPKHVEKPKQVFSLKDLTLWDRKVVNCFFSRPVQVYDMVVSTNSYVALLVAHERINY